MATIPERVWVKSIDGIVDGGYIRKDLVDDLKAELAACQQQRDGLAEVKDAAKIIFDVSNNAFSRANPVHCPHGHIPSYPAHAWWCDDCFGRLKAALAALDNDIG
jgi:hypothetical protein